MDSMYVWQDSTLDLYLSLCNQGNLKINVSGILFLKNVI